MDLDSTGGLANPKGLVFQPEGAQVAHDGQSATETGLSKRPRDAHTIHLILNQYGVNAYQERVPLQLMDFAYRYSSSILQDSLHFINESYPGLQASSQGGSSSKSHSDANPTINLSALRLAIRSRTLYQYNPNLSKEFYTDLMTEKNKIALPPVKADASLQLPPEQYLLTGQHWEMSEDFDMIDANPHQGGGFSVPDANAGGSVQGDDEAEGGTMEDLFGRSGGGDEDRAMEH